MIAHVKMNRGSVHSSKELTGVGGQTVVWEHNWVWVWPCEEGRAAAAKGSVSVLHIVKRMAQSQ